MRLTIHPLEAFDRTANFYNFLDKNFNCFKSGFLLQQRREVSTRALSCLLPAADDSQSHFEVFPLESPNRLFTILRGIDSSSLHQRSLSDADESDQTEESQDDDVTHVYDNNNKIVIRISVNQGSFYSNQISRVESPPGAHIAWIERKKKLLKTCEYVVTGASDPDKVIVSLDDNPITEHEKANNQCGVSLFKGPTDSRTYEIYDHPEIKAGTTYEVFNAGMITGSLNNTNVVEGDGYSIQENNILCHFNPDLSVRKKVLIFSTALIMRFNRDIT